MKITSRNFGYVFLGIIAAASVSHSVFDPIVERKLRSMSRVPNVRVVPEPMRLPLLLKYNQVQHGLTPSESSVVLFGDSQAFGIHDYDEHVFSVLLRKTMPDRELYNFTVIDQRLRDQRIVLETLKRSSFRAGTTVVSANLAHLPDAHGNRISSVSVPYPFLVANPIAWKWIDRFVLHSDNMVMNESNKLFVHHRVPGDRFAMTDESLLHFQNEISRLIGLAASMSRKVIFYVSPVVWEKIGEDGSDPSAVSTAYRSLMDACRRMEAATCLDLRGRFSIEDFQDMVHFNRAGHQKMAMILSNEIQSTTGSELESK